MINFIVDLLAFADQFIPSPIAFITKYIFSPADLPKKLPAPDSSSTPAQHTPEITTFDVLSYNVNNVAVLSPTRRRRILRAIFSSGADIILLQETNEPWEVLLKEEASALQLYSHFHHPGAKDRAAGGLALLSRYPIENVQVLDFTKVIDGSVFPVMTCQLKIPMKAEMSNLPQNMTAGSRRPSSANPMCTVNVANVHLRPPVNLDGSAWFDTARKTEPIRINEVKELIQRTAGGISPQLQAPQLPLDIIAGDFNEGDDAGALSYLKSLGYIDAVQRHVPRRKETHTWPFMKNMWTLRKRLDHILWHEEDLAVTPTSLGGNNNMKLHCLGCGVLSGYEDGASDHQPVLSRFTFVAFE